jgi:predicted DNA-binding transcriptional regulator AlpA
MPSTSRPRHPRQPAPPAAGLPATAAGLPATAAGIAATAAGIAAARPLPSGTAAVPPPRTPTNPARPRPATTAAVPDPRTDIDAAGHAVVIPAQRRPGQRHLTITDLCDELSIARSTFYDWRAKKTAPRCINLPNGELRIRRTDLDAWLESRTDGAIR